MRRRLWALNWRYTKRNTSQASKRIGLFLNFRVLRIPHTERCVRGVRTFYDWHSALWRGHDIRVFGSVARGDAGPQSDIDLLVAVRTGTSVFHDLVNSGWNCKPCLDAVYRDVISENG
ncbi:MAG: nucleotidyltransferase domain-containing protein [Anaerolineae bacterium]